MRNIQTQVSERQFVILH